jgi:membrane protein YdbS with pleckstrin-like domain
LLVVAYDSLSPAFRAQSHDQRWTVLLVTLFLLRVLLLLHVLLLLWSYRHHLPVTLTWSLLVVVFVYSFFSLFFFPAQVMEEEWREWEVTNQSIAL